MSVSTATLADKLNVREQTLRKIGVYVAMYGAGALFLLPYVYMISTTFQPTSMIYDANPHLIPPEITFKWYRLLFEKAPMVQWTINTVIIAGGTTVVVVVVDSLIAFAITRLEWPGRKVIFSVILASFMIPAVVNLIPIFEIISNLGLLNQYLGVILPLSASGLGVFLLVQFFKDFPEELEEAARLDGFTTFEVYYRLILPLMKPALTALALYTFIWTWNQFVLPLVILQQQAKYTLPIGLVTIRDAYATAQMPGLTLTSAVVASLPLFVLFLVLQNHLIQAIEMQGTVK